MKSIPTYFWMIQTCCYLLDLPSPYNFTYFLALPCYPHSFWVLFLSISDWPMAIILIFRGIFLFSLQGKLGLLPSMLTSVALFIVKGMLCLPTLILPWPLWFDLMDAITDLRCPLLRACSVSWLRFCLDHLALMQRLQYMSMCTYYSSFLQFFCVFIFFLFFFASQRV